MRNMATNTTEHDIDKKMRIAPLCSTACVRVCKSRSNMPKWLGDAQEKLKLVDSLFIRLVCGRSGILFGGGGDTGG